MEMKTNAFKAALRSGPAQIGFWVGTGDPYVTEIFASVGYDWLLIDGEHGPNDLRSTLGQLQAMAGHTSQAVVRPVKGDAAILKQLLDIGAQNLLVPMVESAEQARALVAATRYPPAGIRGVGTALARASAWKQIPDYLERANAEICLLAQVESATALKDLDGIAATEGIDGVFFGPADLSASMGHLTNPGHPDVQKAIDEGIKCVQSHGKAVGILTTNEGLAHHYLELGARFVAVGVDTISMVTSAKSLLEKYR
ncbi:MAG: 4-hydroxy-2-oxoheptanedioate aldolase [Alcaligenaceae bacterium]|nr:4-hydroxy-2-oxoheptanedioate aldolase [Alcaligenaceae bacterium]